MIKRYSKRLFLGLLLVSFLVVVFPRTAGAWNLWGAICDAAEAVADAVVTVVDTVVEVVKDIAKAILDALLEFDLVADEEMHAFCDSWDENMSDYQDQSNCDSCKIFMVIYDAASKVSGQISSTLSGPAKGLVVTFGLLWIGFQTIAFYSSVGAPPDPMEYLTKVGGIFLRVVFGAMFLSGGAAMTYSYFVNPMISTAMGLGSTALGMTQRSGGGNVGASFSAGGGGGGSGPLSGGLRSSVKSMIEKMASSMAEGQSIAQGLRCGSAFWKKISMKSKILPLPDIYILIPNPIMFMFGAWVGFCFWLISVLFCFAMMDTIFRLGLIVSMTPVFIAAWVFPVTKGFFEAGKDMFLNTLMCFFVAGVTASLIVVIVEKAWDVGKGEATSTFLDLMRESEYVQAWDSAMASAGLAKLFLITIFLFWGMKIAPKSDDLAGKIMGTDFPESTAIKALKAVIGLIIDIIFLIITIITVGCGSVIYVCKVFQYFAKAMKYLKKLEKIADKIKKAAEKMQKLQKKAEKLKKAAEKAKKVADKGSKAASFVTDKMMG